MNASYHPHPKIDLLPDMNIVIASRIPSGLLRAFRRGYSSSGPVGIASLYWSAIAGHCTLDWLRPEHRIDNEGPLVTW